jgi:RNA polymerase sigma-70 factor (ECF subfamily)
VTITIDHVKRNPVVSVNETTADFEAIFQQHWPRVYGVLFRLTGDPDEAQDLALEVFWRLHQRLPTGGDRQNPSSHTGQALGGWLYRVATNLGYNALRAAKRRTHYEQEAGALALETDTPPHPEAQVEQAQERRHVRRALACMEPRSAQLLILRHSGLSYAEIAAALSVAPGSVGTLLARAEKEFEKCYEKAN